MSFVKQIRGGCCAVWFNAAWFNAAWFNAAWFNAAWFGAAWLSLSGVICAQEGDILRGQGAFLRGAGWYNLHTAQANRVNVEAAIRWKEDLRKIQRERAYYDAQKAESKKLTVEEFRRQMALKEQELRTNPTINDVQSGAALNALFYDLTDPDLTSDKWKSVSPVQLPPGTSVKELIFAFTPHKVSSQASAALTRGVIALSRLEIKDKWPVLMKKDQLAQERKAYEDSYIRVRDKVLKGDYAVEEILALDKALDNLKEKTLAEIPSERGYRIQAVNFVNDLRDATRMFDANTVDYAREILIDTKDHDAGTVEELVAFMTKYRLAFSNSERSPTTRALYSDIYEKLRQQLNALVPSPSVAPSPDSLPSKADEDGWVSLFNGKDLSGWKLSPFWKIDRAGRWEVKSGILTSVERDTRLVTDKELGGDFRFRAEVMISPGNTGQCEIVFAHRRNEGEKDGPHPSEHRVLLSVRQNEKTKDFHLVLSRDGFAPKELQAATSATPIQRGKWCLVELRVTGRKIEFFVDGNKVNELEKERKLPSGSIGFMVWHGPSLSIRKVELKRTP